MGLKEACHVGEKLADYWIEEGGQEKLERNDTMRKMMREIQDMRE